MPPDSSSPSPQPLQPNRPQSGAGSAIAAFFSYWLISWIVVPVGLVLILHFFVFSAYHVVGTSMLPTLQDSNYLIVSKVDHTGASVTRQDYIPQREQIIVFHYPKQPTLDFVKRVIGLPGERVVVSNCKVTVYNQQHPNGFNPDAVHQIEGQCTEGSIDETIPAGNIFVLGDNRTPNGSFDSRDWGYLPSYDIIGNVVLRLYPFANFRIF
jgi:signal peptidase I